MLQDEMTLRFIANVAASRNSEPELRDYFAGVGWDIAVFINSGPSVLPARFKRQPVKVGADGVVVIGIGAEDSRLHYSYAVSRRKDYILLLLYVLLIHPPQAKLNCSHKNQLFSQDLQIQSCCTMALSFCG